MKQKFKTGDRVRIKRLPSNMSHFPGEGKLATVEYSYTDRYGGTTRQESIYSLKIDGVGSCSWYDESLLTFVEPRVETEIANWLNDFVKSRNCPLDSLNLSPRAIEWIRNNLT